ncbi:hypothetical protein R6Z07F_009742 [Ovis aries]
MSPGRKGTRQVSTLPDSGRRETMRGRERQVPRPLPVSAPRMYGIVPAEAEKERQPQPRPKDSFSNQAISLLNSEVSMMRKAILQYCMARDILRASKGVILI